MILNRRGFITGLISLVAAPAIVRVQSIMPVKALATVPDPLPAYYEPIGVLKDAVLGGESYPGAWRLFGIPSSFEKEPSYWDCGTKLFRGNFAVVERNGLAGQSDYKLVRAPATDDETPRQLVMMGDGYYGLKK
jgi:hypothetical protein